MDRAGLRRLGAWGLWCLWLGLLWGAPAVLALPGLLPVDGHALAFSGLRMLMATCGVLGIVAGARLVGSNSGRRFRRALVSCGFAAGAAYSAVSWGVASGVLAGGSGSPLGLLAPVILGVAGMVAGGVASFCHASLAAWLLPEAVGTSAEAVSTFRCAEAACRLVLLAGSFVLAWGLMAVGARDLPNWTVVRVALAHAWPVEEWDWWQIMFYLLPPGFSGAAGHFSLRAGVASVGLRSLTPTAAWAVGSLLLVGIGSCAARPGLSGSRGGCHTSQAKEPLRVFPLALLAALFLGAAACWASCCAWPLLMDWLIRRGWAVVAVGAALLVSGALMARVAFAPASLGRRARARAGAGGGPASAVPDGVPVAGNMPVPGGVIAGGGPASSGGSAVPGDATEEEYVAHLASCGSLSARETEAVVHRLRGMGSGEAARQMGISPSTVRNLQARACAKLGVSSFGELVEGLAGELGRGEARGSLEGAPAASGGASERCNAPASPADERQCLAGRLTQALGLASAMAPDAAMALLSVVLFLLPLGSDDPDALVHPWQRAYVRVFALGVATLCLVAWRGLSGRMSSPAARTPLTGGEAAGPSERELEVGGRLETVLHLSLCLAAGIGWGAASVAGVFPGLVSLAFGLAVLVLALVGLGVGKVAELCRSVREAGSLGRAACCLAGAQDRLARRRRGSDSLGVGWLLFFAGALVGSYASWPIASVRDALVLLGEGGRAVGLASMAGAAKGALVLLGAAVLVVSALLAYQVLNGLEIADPSCHDERRVRAYLVSRGLSETQVSVAVLTMRGLSRSQVAVRLNIAGGTVNSARYQAYRVLGVHTRRELCRVVRKGMGA